MPALPRPVLVGSGVLTDAVIERLIDVAILYGEPVRVVQGSQRPITPQSAATHSGTDGGLDVSRLQANARMVRCFRLLGHTAWVRDEAHGGFDPHVHAVPWFAGVGLHDEALAQVRAQRDGFDGLGAGGRGGPDYHGRPAKWERLGAKAKVKAFRGLAAVAPAARVPIFRTALRRGARGRAVLQLQRRLNLWKRESEQIAQDGFLGPQTQAAVDDFARGHGLGPAWQPNGRLTYRVYDVMFPKTGPIARLFLRATA